MTTIAELFVPDGIVMCADSYMQVIDSYASEEIQGLALIQKLFLIEKTGTGISGIGHAGVTGMLMRDVLLEFASSLNSTSISQASVAQNLADFMGKSYSQMDTNFHLCGYDEDKPFVYEIERDSSAKWVVTWKNIDPFGNQTFGIQGLYRTKTTQFAQGLLAHSFPYLRIDPAILSVSDAIRILEILYAFELGVASHDEFAGSGGPLDLLILQPSSQHFHAARDLGAAILG